MNSGIMNQKIGGMNIVAICLLLAVITIPLDYLWNSYFIALFSIVALLSNNFFKKIEYLKANKFFWIVPAAYFFWSAITLLWDKQARHSEYIIKGLESKVSWVAFPIIFASIERIDPKSIKKILFAFIATNIAGSLYCLWKAYLEYKATNYINILFYHHLSRHINISAIYFSMYCVFSIYILFFYFFFKKQSGWIRLLSLLCVGYLAVFIMLLSSKIFIFLLYLSALIFIVYSFYYFKSKLGTLIMLVLLIAIPVLLIKFPYVQSRVLDTHIKEYSGPEDDQNGLAVRGVLWESSWKLIRSKPILGWGRYSAQDALEKQYMRMGFLEGVKENYNSHNQYLYTWLCYGLTGLLLIAIYFSKLLQTFIRKKQLLGIGLLFLFIFANITECMLEVQKGLVFFLLFVNLFLFHPLRQQLGKVTA